MNELLVGLGVALRMVPAIAPITIIAAWRSKWLPPVALILLALSIGSMLAYGIVRMNYEDFDLPFPLWWTLGLGAAQVEAIVLTVGLAFLGGDRSVGASARNGSTSVANARCHPARNSGTASSAPMAVTKLCSAPCNYNENGCAAAG